MVRNSMKATPRGHRQVNVYVVCSAAMHAPLFLRRIDQRNLPLNQQYEFGSTSSAGTGRGVTIYTLDSGVRLSHSEFLNWPGTSSRASYGSPCPALPCPALPCPALPCPAPPPPLPQRARARLLPFCCTRSRLIHVFTDMGIALDLLHGAIRTRCLVVVTARRSMFVAQEGLHHRQPYGARL